MAIQTGVRFPRPIAAPSAVAAPDIFAPPTTPSKYDDEFSTTTLKSIWTQVASPGTGFETSYNAEGTFLKMNSPGAGSNNSLVLRQQLDGADSNAGVALQFTSRFLLSAYSGAVEIYSSFLISDSSTYGGGNFINAALSENSGQYRLTCYDGSFQYQNDVDRMFNEVWLHYQRSSGNTVRIFASPNGRSWRRIYSGSKTWNANYLYIALQGHGSSGNASTHLVDFLRVNDSRFTQFIA